MPRPCPPSERLIDVLRRTVPYRPFGVLLGAVPFAFLCCVLWRAACGHDSNEAGPAAPTPIRRRFSSESCRGRPIAKCVSWGILYRKRRRTVRDAARLCR